MEAKTNLGFPISGLLFWLSLFLLTSCGSDYIPKPRGLFRIDLPEKVYAKFDSLCPFTFLYPVYGKITPHQEASKMLCWMNIDYPAFMGKLHLSYFPIDEKKNNESHPRQLQRYLEDSRSLAYKHTVKAEAIDEQVFVNNSTHVYGTLYDIEGDNTASSVQFYVTDSVTHFIRGALYFSIAPRNDSLAPVIDFIKEDIINLVESLEWKN